MSGERDDDALSWAGDDDPTLQAPRAHGGAADGELPQGWSVVGSASEADTDSTSEADALPGVEEPAPLSSSALITLGVVGGILLLYTVGWVISVGRLNTNYLGTYLGDPLGGFMFMLGGWLAIVAPAIWMCTTLWLTREGRARGRILWFLLGIVVLLPWPLLIGR